MATIRRDIAPGKEKKGMSISPQTGTTTTKFRGTPTYPSKTNSSATLTPKSAAPQKHTPNYLRPARNPNVDVSKHLGKKPASTVSVQKPTVSRIQSPASTVSVQKPTVSRMRSSASIVSAQKPTVSRIRSSDKTTLTTTQKTRVSTNVSHGSSSFSGKTSVSQKLVPSKNVKAPVKDVGKRSSLYGRPVSTVKKSGIKKKEAENSTTAAKKQQISNISRVEIENSSTSVVPKPEPEPEPESQQKMQPEDQESCIPEAAEQMVQAVNNNEKGTDDLVMEDQELLNIGQIESQSDDKDASKIVIAEDNTVPEHQDAPFGIKTEEAEDKLHIEQTSIKQEELDEHNTNEVIRSNNDENIADNPNEEEVVEEKEVVEVQEKEFDKKEEKEVIEVQEIATDKKDEATNGSEVNEYKETERQEVVEEKKQEAENVAPKGKKESAVSNDVIEETASKLREQRKNKVKALAGAFETVISLQETK